MRFKHGKRHTLFEKYNNTLWCDPYVSTNRRKSFVYPLLRRVNKIAIECDGSLCFLGFFATLVIEESVNAEMATRSKDFGFFSHWRMHSGNTGSEREREVLEI